MVVIKNRAARRALMITTGVIGVLAAPGVAFAQTDAPATQERGENVEGIQDIVVTARRSNESSQRVPIAITTVTDQGLRDLSVRDVVDVQRVTPGLYIQSANSGGRAKVTIRGQGEADSRLTTDGSVGVYVDNVNFARSYGLRTGMVDLAQVEVLKGPQGTLFGKNTTGGALNITTQHPTYEWGGSVDLLYGSYNKVQGTAVLNAPLSDRLAVRVVGQVTSREGFGKFYNGQDANDENTLYGRALLRGDPAENVHFLLSADYAKQRNNGRTTVLTYDAMLANANTATGSLGAIAKELGLNPASAADRLTAYNAWKVYYDKYQSGHAQDFYGNSPAAWGPFYDNFDHYGFSGNFDVELGGVTFRSITAYRVLDASAQSDSDSTPFELFQSLTSFQTRNFSQEFQLSSIDGHGLDWQAGAFYNRERGHLVSITNTSHYVSASNARIEDVNSINSSRAAYAQAVLNVTPEFRLTGGIRYTRDTKTIDSHNRTDTTLALTPSPATGTASSCALLSPALGGPTLPNCTYVTSTTSSRVTWLASADWRPVPEAMLYASVSTGYRAGGFTQQANTSVIASVNALNAAFTPFSPEDVTNYEVGFKSDWFGHRLRVNGSFYYQDYRNVQVSVRDIVNGITINLIRNGAQATLYGGELEVTAEPVRGLTLNANVAYLHAKYDSFITRDTAGNPIDLTAQPFAVPEWTYNLAGAYEVPLTDGSIRFNVNYAFTGTTNLVPGQPGVAITVYNPASVTQRGYGLLDARISWKIDSQGLEVAVFGRNLTNQYYFLQAARGESIGYNFGTPGDPRTFGVQVRKTF